MQNFALSTRRPLPHSTKSHQELCKLRLASKMIDFPKPKEKPFKEFEENCKGITGNMTDVKQICFYVVRTNSTHSTVPQSTCVITVALSGASYHAWTKLWCSDVAWMRHLLSCLTTTTCRNLLACDVNGACNASALVSETVVFSSDTGDHLPELLQVSEHGAGEQGERTVGERKIIVHNDSYLKHDRSRVRYHRHCGFRSVRLSRLSSEHRICTNMPPTATVVVVFGFGSTGKLG